MKNILTICVFLNVLFSFGQLRDSLPDFNDDYFLVKEGDTLSLSLKEVQLFPAHKFKSYEDQHYYKWFRKKVFKAYPYAVLAAKRIDSLNVRLSRISSKRKKKRYVKNVQKYLESELTGQLKRMTRTEGRVLIKLIHRQTGKTVYENVKELRSGYKAFMYNAQASLFSISLKDDYSPATENEDYLIEDIIQRAHLDDYLEKQEPKLAFDPHQILASHKGQINVEVYKQMFAKMRKRKKRK